jgi:ABC-2 type transport system permease protein
MSGTARRGPAMSGTGRAASVIMGPLGGSLRPARTPRQAFRKMVQSEARLARRQPIGPALGLGMPVVLLVIFGSLPAFHKHYASLGGLTYFNVYLPILLALVLAALWLWSLPTPLATYREQGILRRLSTTPAPPPWVLAAQLVLNAGQAVLALIVLVVVGITAFGVEAPKSIVGLILMLLVSMAALFSIGLVIAAIAPTGQAAGAIGSAVFFPMMFFAGLWVPRNEMPSALRGISDFTPLGASVQGLQSSLFNGFPSAAPIVVLLAYSVVAAVLAVRFFRWE